MNGYSFPSRRTFAIAGRCRRRLLQQTVYRSLTEPTHISRDADSSSRSSTIHNSAMAMKSPRVLRGQLASQNAFAMLQLFSLRICSTLWYLVWIVARLWVLARVASFCWGCCWGSSESVKLGLEFVLMASTNLVFRVLMASDFVWISHLDKFLCELCINCAAEKQEWRTLRGSSLCSVSSKVPVGQLNKKEMGISQLRAHSLVYHSDDSRSRLPCVTWYTNFCTETLNYKVKKSSLAWYSLLSFWN